MNLVVGLLVGWASSLFLLAVSRTAFRARLLFAPEVSVTASANAETPEKLRYRVKVKNVSLFRDIADIAFTATLNITGLDANARANTVIMRLDISSEAVQSLRAGTTRILTIAARDVSPFMRVRLLDLGHPELILGGERDLQALMLAARAAQLQPDAVGQARPAPQDPWIAITAIVTEAWTGRQFVIRSPKYKVPTDFVPGVYSQEVKAHRRQVAKVRRWLRERGEARNRRQSRRVPSLLVVRRQPPAVEPNGNENRTEGS